MTLDPRRVPDSAVPLLPLAQRWNIGDDSDRELAVEALDDRELATLAHCLADVDDDFWEWLAAAEEESTEYLALVVLTMSADLAKVILEQRYERRYS